MLEEEERRGGVWLTMRDSIVTDAEDFLGPLADGDEGDRLVASDNGTSILVAYESELESLAAYVHDRFHRCGGFATHTSLEAAREALEPRTGDPGALAPPFLGPAETTTVNRLMPLVSESQIRSTITGLANFPTRHYQSTTGVDAANWIRDRWATMAAGREDVTVELFTHSGWAQPSVMMTIEGVTSPGEHVVMGAHEDSITFSGATAPGADDDASGVATMTEVARLILADGVRLQKTVVFIAYAAEEVGLRGSDQISAQFKAQGKQVTGVMQLDMTNYAGTTGVDFVLLTDYTSATLTNTLDTLAGTYLPTLVTERDACGYACSDHASWFQDGFATVMPFESLLDDYNPTIHTSNDRLSVSGGTATNAVKFGKLAVAWLVETARVAGATSGVVRIGQVAYDAPGLEGHGEFIELYNTGSAAIDIGGWTVRTPTALRTMPAGTSVPGGGWLTLARNRDGFTTTYGQAPDLARAVPVLANTAGELRLHNASGTVVDMVRWETIDWPLNAIGGQSIARAAPGGTDSNTAADWRVVTADPH